MVCGLSFRVHFWIPALRTTCTPPDRLLWSSQLNPALSCLHASNAASCITSPGKGLLSTVIQFNFFERHVYSSYPIPVPDVPDRFPTLLLVIPPSLHRRHRVHYMIISLCFTHLNILTHVNISHYSFKMFVFCARMKTLARKPHHHNLCTPIPEPESLTELSNPSWWQR